MIVMLYIVCCIAIWGYTEVKMLVCVIRNYETIDSSHHFIESTHTRASFLRYYHLIQRLQAPTSSHARTQGANSLRSRVPCASVCLADGTRVADWAVCLSVRHLTRQVAIGRSTFSQPCPETRAPRQPHKTPSWRHSRCF